jgi:hypothetical protein
MKPAPAAGIAATTSFAARLNLGLLAQAYHACISACMVALQIRDVPEELRDRLSELASQRGQSLQAYLFDVVSNEARRQDNLAVLDRFGQGTYGTRLSSADIDGALRTARAERDAELGVREGEG